MTVISIIGTRGVGKSFLVRQLAAFNNLPCFLEGEEGVLTDELLEKIASGKDPIESQTWFRDKFAGNLELAHRISRSGVDCLVDGSILTVKAHIPEQDEEYWEELYELVDGYDHLMPHRTILLTASEETLRGFIQGRGRKSEQEKQMLERAMIVQEQFLELTDKHPDITTINRDNLDFTKTQDLEYMTEKILG